MTPTLSEEQRQALQADDGSAVIVEDTETHTQYVIIPADAYRDLQSFQQKYNRDLEQLRDDIQIGRDQLDRGEGIELEGDQALREFFDDIQRRGRERYDAHKAAS